MEDDPFREFFLFAAMKGLSAEGLDLVPKHR
jgi:hypothetical protein